MPFSDSTSGVLRRMRDVKGDMSGLCERAGTPTVSASQSSASKVTTEFASGTVANASSMASRAPTSVWPSVATIFSTADSDQPICAAVALVDSGSARL